MRKGVFKLLIILAALVWLALFYWPDNHLHLVFCDVGQGDAVLVSRGFSQILVDGGPDEQVLQCLSDHLPFWDRTIEMVVLTHPQADHLTGLISVAERYNIKYFVINNIINDTARFWKFREVLLDEGAELYNPKAGERMKIGDLNFSVLWPQERLGDNRLWNKNLAFDFDKIKNQRQFVKNVLGASSFYGDLNETSIVLQLSYEDFDALLSGDIGFETENQIDLRPIEVLKVAHHGSKYSTSEEFLKKTQPALAVISVGKNSFGHPSEEAMKRLRDDNIKILRTDQNGEVEIESDGQKWRVLPER